MKIQKVSFSTLVKLVHHFVDDAGVKYVVHNGPQQVLLKMFDVAVKNGMRVFMKERIESLDRHGGGKEQS